MRCVVISGSSQEVAVFLECQKMAPDVEILIWRR